MGEAIREILLSVEHSDLSAWAEANLYTAARAQLVKEVILPHLARGYIVVADRYADSTLAYQGAGRGLEVAILSAMQAVLKLRPDLTPSARPRPGGGLSARPPPGAPDRMESEGWPTSGECARATSTSRPGRLTSSTWSTPHCPLKPWPARSCGLRWNEAQPTGSGRGWGLKTRKQR